MENAVYKNVYVTKLMQHELQYEHYVRNVLLVAPKLSGVEGVRICTVYTAMHIGVSYVLNFGRKIVSGITGLTNSYRKNLCSSRVSCISLLSS